MGKNSQEHAPAMQRERAPSSHQDYAPDANHHSNYLPQRSKQPQHPTTHTIPNVQCNMNIFQYSHKGLNIRNGNIII